MDREEIARLVREINVVVYLKFKKVKWGTRVINKLDSGMKRRKYPLWIRGSDSYSKVYRGDSLLTSHNKPFWWLCAAVPLLRVKTA